MLVYLRFLDGLIFIFSEVCLLINIESCEQDYGIGRCFITLSSLTFKFLGKFSLFGIFMKQLLSDSLTIRIMFL